MAALLRLLALANLPGMALALVLSPDPAPLGVLARTLLALTGLPLVAAWLVERAFAAELRIEGGQISLTRPGLRVSGAVGGLVALRPWRLPLPGPGFTLRLATGGPESAQTSLGLLCRRSDLLLAQLEAAGAVSVPRAASPLLAWEIARAARPRSWRRSVLLRQGAFALLPGGVGFYAHQHIAFGAFLGQLLLQGTLPWLRSLGEYLAIGVIYLVIWDAVVRVLVEVPVLLATAAGPNRARLVRRAADAVVDVVYFTSVPAMLALRFLG